MQPSARDLTKPQQARSTYTSAPIHRLFMAKAREARERLELELHRDLAKVEHELHRLVHQLTFSLRLRAVLAASLVHVTVYSAANHWPLGTPRLLTLTAFDQAMPFLPLTAFAYVSAYALVFVAFLSLRREASQVRFLEVFIACVLAAGFIHWALPTTYPRALYPLTDDVTAPARALLSLVRAFDTPNSCLPSLHVAISLASAGLVRRERPLLFLGLMAWALVIVVSTLTTKQHYLVDVVSGAALALVSTVLVDLVNKRREAKVSGDAPVLSGSDSRPSQAPD
jgi:membrane-associated phospholipid phosphatase